MNVLSNDSYRILIQVRYLPSSISSIHSPHLLWIPICSKKKIHTAYFLVQQRIRFRFKHVLRFSISISTANVSLNIFLAASKQKVFSTIDAIYKVRRLQLFIILFTLMLSHRPRRASMSPEGRGFRRNDSNRHRRIECTLSNLFFLLLSLTHEY